MKKNKEDLRGRFDNFEMKVGIFLQVRVDSRRVCRKMWKLLGGKPLVGHVMDRLKSGLEVLGVDKVTVLTSLGSVGDLCEFFEGDDRVEIYFGDEEDVLERFYFANRILKNEVIIRATGDNPFVSVEHMELILRHHVDRSADLSHYVGLPLGCGVEVMSERGLRLAYEGARRRDEKEHVTRYMYENRGIFKVEEPVIEGRYYRPGIRVTMDEEEDFRVGELLIRNGVMGELGKLIEVWDGEVIREGLATGSMSL